MVYQPQSNVFGPRTGGIFQANNGRFKRRRRRGGAACVEMAFVAPFVFMLVFGSIEFARMVMIQQSLTSAARLGCRKAALITTQSYQAAETVARDSLAGTIAQYQNSSIVRMTTTPAFSASPVDGTDITLNLEVDCADVSWLPPMFFAGAKFRGSATMKRE